MNGLKHSFIALAREETSVKTLAPFKHGFIPKADPPMADKPREAIEIMGDGLSLVNVLWQFK
jgi:hypothetical protein